MFSQLTRPAIIAHRGASRYAPENTLAAFHMAVEQGAEALELDVALSAEGEVVILHDDTVDRTTDGTGRVGALTLADLKRLDAGSFFSPAFRGERIPTLAEVLEAVGHKILINIELKANLKWADPLPAKVAEIVQRHGLEDGVLYSSFSPWALARIHKLTPQVPIGFLTLPGFLGKLGAGLFGRWLPHQARNPSFKEVTPDGVAHLHRQGKRVYPYTVNQLEDIQRMIRAGVDGFFTDDTPLAQRIRAQEAQP